MGRLKTFESLPVGVVLLRKSSLEKDAWLVECSHHESLRMDRSVPTPSGATYCSVCKGDQYTTKGYVLRTKLIAVVPEPKVGAQEALF